MLSSWYHKLNLLAVSEILVLMSVYQLLSCTYYCYQVLLRVAGFSLIILVRRSYRLPRRNRKEETFESISGKERANSVSFLMGFQSIHWRLGIENISLSD